MSAFADQNHRILPVKIEITHDEEKLTRDIKSLVQEMLSFSAEETESLSVSPLTGGITNRLYLVENAMRPDYHVIVRFFGEGTHEFIDRNAENMVFAALSDKHFGPRFEGLFENGRVEGYLHARCVLPAEMSQPAVMRQVAHVVQRLHSFHLPHFFAYQHGWQMTSSPPAYRRPSLNNKNINSSAVAPLPVTAEHTHANRAEPWVWKKIHLFFSLALGTMRSLEESSSPEDLARLEVYRQLGLDVMFEETKWLQQRVEKILAQLAFHMHYHDHIHGLKAPDGVHDRVSARDQGMAYALEEVLCHNDLLSGNILVMREHKLLGMGEKVDVRLIDYEYAAYNYRSYDLANHFCGEKNQRIIISCQFFKSYYRSYFL